MKTTARQATAQIATDTANLTDLVTAGLFDDFDNCEMPMCGLPAAYLYTRLTEDGDEVRACETCVDTHHLAYAAD
jgi:hypothetical protein